MASTIELLRPVPDYLWGIAIVVIAVVLAYLIWRSVTRALFRHRLKTVAESPEKLEPVLMSRYNPADFVSMASVLEAAVRRWPEADLLHLTGADEIWIQRLAQRPNKRWVERVLEFTPDKGMFTVFLAALKHAKAAEIFRTWLSENDDLLALRKVAASGKGESFDGRKAMTLLQDRLDQVREMIGDPLWASRYMALKVLLYDQDERTTRALWEAFHDPHSLVRRTVVEEFKPAGKEANDQLHDELVRLLINDFVYEVRAAAKQRLNSDYPDRQQVKYKQLSKIQKLHLVQQLDQTSNEDRDFAFSVLEGKDDELSLYAARFLEEAGALKQMFLHVDFSDRKALERNRALLEHAAAVNQLGFLESLRSAKSPATWLIAAHLLSQKGSEKLVHTLVEKAGTLKTREAPEYREVFEAVFQCACRCGSEQAAGYVAEYLLENRSDGDKAAFILGELDGRFASVYVPALIKLLKDPDFAQLEALYSALVKFDSSFYLDELLDVISADRNEYPHQVRISAFQVVGRLKLPYCLQTILEHLPILPLDQAREFAKHLAAYNGKVFTERAQAIFEGEDGKVRAALIAAVPETENKEFLKPIRDSLDDADPNVRSAAAYALLEYGDTRSVKQVREMLRDPVESVRSDVARALGQYGNDASLKHFEELCTDENEVLSVKLAAIQGLRASQREKAVDILVGYLKSDAEQDLQDEIIDALADKNSSKELARLVSHMKDAEHELRDKLVQAFSRMGYDSEAVMVELLREDIASLRPYITSVLEETGFIDHTIRKLSHRDPQVRRDAAELLSLIGTVAAFRGIVLASRDPDEQVRVRVTKALERLNTKEGNEILDQLKEDPDPKIRKYTLWALERIKVKNS
ncbi:MAG: HEAT repeat domain-containing protein [Spirochaetota bacterium]